MSKEPGAVQSKHRVDIVDELMSSVLDSHAISGMTEKGVHVRKEVEDAVQFYAANNVLTGPLRIAFDRLCKRLAIN